MRLSFNGAARSVTGSRHMAQPPCDVLILDSTYCDRLHEADQEIMKQTAPGLLTHFHGEEKQDFSLSAAIQAEQPNTEVTVPHVGSSHEV